MKGINRLKLRLEDMKKLVSIMLVFTVLINVNSCKDKFDQLANSDFAPGIASIFPGENSKVVQGDFDLIANFVDGTVSPLAEGIVTLSDANGDQVISVTKTLSGVADSVFVRGTEFGAPSLALGFYTLAVTGTDVSGKFVSTSHSFEISSLPYAANNDEIYIAGSFNGWVNQDSPTINDFKFTLVAPNLWELNEVVLDGGEWKLKNTQDWSDQDWGDGNCDGVVEVTSGGGANSNCGHSGLNNITFNDETLIYTIEPSVVHETNLSSLYVLGNFNDFQGPPDYEFSLITDNTWQLDEIHLSANDIFKFSETPSFSGVNFGDNEMDGVADEFGSNITLADDFTEGMYKIIFNEQTLAYTLEFVNYSTIGIIGDATPGGWDEDTDMNDNGDGTFGIVIPLTVGGAKFRNGNAWHLNWGGSTFPTGTTSGDNIPVNSAGLYSVTFNPTTGEYSFVLAELYKVGSFNGWDAANAVPFNFIDGIFELRADATTDEAFKFLGQQDWSPVEYNYGFFSSLPADISDDSGNLKYNGATREYLYRVDIDAQTFSFVKSGLFKVGSENGWNDSNNPQYDAFDFTKNAPGEFEYVATLVTGEQFKLVDTAGYWSYGNFGYGDFVISGAAAGDLSDAGGNIQYDGAGGSFTIVVDLNAGTMTIN